VLGNVLDFNEAFDMACRLCLWLVLLAVGRIEVSAVATLRAEVSSSTKSLDDEVVTSEEQAHTQFDRWCKSTVPAQVNRRQALQELLTQAKPAAVESSQMQQVAREASLLEASLEQQRIAVEVADGARKKQLLAAELDTEDAAKSYDAMQKAYARLGGGAASTNSSSSSSSAGLFSSRGLSVVGGLLPDVQAEVQQEHTKLVQVESSSTGKLQLKQLEQKYLNKMSELEQLRHLQVSSERSMDVLMSALEDESGYLSDLQGLCSMETQVHQRLESTVLPSLQNALAGTQAAHMDSPDAAAQVAQVAPPNLAAALQALPSTPVPKMDAASTTLIAPGVPAVLDVATMPVPAKPNVPATSQEALKHVQVAPVLSAAKAARVKQAAPVARIMGAVAAAFHKLDKAQAPTASKSKTPAAMVAAPSVPTKIAHEVAKIPPAKTDAQEVDEEAEADFNDEPVFTQASTGAKPVPGVKVGSVSAKLRAAPVALTAEMPSAAVAHPVPVATQHSKLRAPKQPNVPAASMSQVDDDSDFLPAHAHVADSAEEDLTAVIKSAKSKAETNRSGKAGKAKAFLDQVYDSAAGNMPTQYTAWTPDAGATPATTPAASVHKTFASGVDGDELSSPALVVPATHATSSAIFVSPSTSYADPRSPAATSAGAPKVSMIDSGDRPTLTPQARSFKDQMQQLSEGFDSDDGSEDTSFSGAQTTQRGQKVAPAAPVLSKTDVDVATRVVAKTTLDAAVPVVATTGLGAEIKPVISLSAIGVPQQYDAWTPHTSSKAAADDKKAMVAQMAAAFDGDDDDVPPTQAAASTKQISSLQAPSNSHVAAATPAYDDEDLPRHGGSAATDFKGGWQAMLKTGAVQKKAKSLKQDKDVEIMQSLYTSDGGLPSQYTAWSPVAPQAAAAAPQAAAAAPQVLTSSQMQTSAAPQASATPAGSSTDFAAAAAAFEKEDDSDSFLQVASESHLAQMIKQAFSPAVSSSMSLIDESTWSTDASTISAANVVLEVFAEEFQSKPLRQLSNAKLTAPKLEALFQKLQAVDPVTHAGVALGTGKQAEAAKWCEYFEDNVQSTAPVRSALSNVEKAKSILTQVTAKRTALTEEIDARTQLLKTIEQDAQSLSILLQSAKQAPDTTALDARESEIAAQSTGSAGFMSFKNLGIAVEGVEGAKTELSDAIEITLRKRRQVVQEQKTKLALLQATAKSADSEWSHASAKAAKMEAAVDTARKSLGGIQVSCDTALTALARHGHAGHMEMKAVEMALSVLRSK